MPIIPTNESDHLTLVFVLTMIACSIEGLFLGVLLYKCAKRVFKKTEENDENDMELTEEAIT